MSSHPSQSLFSYCVFRMHLLLWWKVRSRTYHLTPHVLLASEDVGVNPSGRGDPRDRAPLTLWDLKGKFSMICLFFCLVPSTLVIRVNHPFQAPVVLVVWEECEGLRKSSLVILLPAVAWPIQDLVSAQGRVLGGHACVFFSLTLVNLAGNCASLVFEIHPQSSCFLPLSWWTHRSQPLLTHLLPLSMCPTVSALPP